MTFFLCKLWPYLAGGLIGWLLAGWLARRFKYAEPPIERIVEKVVEVDNPKHLSTIRKLEGENSQIAGLMSKVSQIESKKPEVVEKIIEKRVEVDNPKHLSRISSLEKDNAEMVSLRAKLSGFGSQEATLRKLKEENAQISVLQNSIRNFKSNAEKEGNEIADLNAKATHYRAQIEKLKKENQYLDGLQAKLKDLGSDEPKQLALISRLEKENKELADLKAQQAKFDAQENKLLTLETENAKILSLQSDLNKFENDNTQQLSLIAKLEQEKTQTTKKVTDLEGEVSSLKSGPQLDLSAAKEAGIEITDENDLVAVEGIGPKTKELLQSSGLKSLKDLSESSPSDVQDILNKGGAKFQMANPGTWADQASLACNNRWSALKSLQDVLDGGVYPNASAQLNENKSTATATSLDLVAAKASGIILSKEGDFTAIEGIGPKISELIYADGIKTFKALSEVEPARLQTILDKAGPQYKMANPGTWPDQAHLVCNNRWPALKALQDVLDGGVYPDRTKVTGSGSNDSAKVQKLEAELKAYRDKEQTAQGSVADTDKAKAAGFTMRRKGEQDDFTVIEGIGPKINELIHAEGIHTFSELADTQLTLIQTVLDKAGPSFTLADPGTWSAQSDLAAKNEWKKLMKWQDELDGGKS